VVSEQSLTPDAPPPDPARGVFETILVFENRPVELDAHLERLAASVRELYDAKLPESRELVLANSRGGGLGRLRLTMAPRPGGQLASTVIVAGVDPADLFPGPELAIELSTLPVPRGLGDHKWADRERLVRAEASCGPRVVPLLVGPGGKVYEGSRGNVFAVADGALLTPPLDGEILPGVARTRTIEVARGLGIEVAERTLLLPQLREADAVFMTGSIRGVEPVGALDGEELSQEGDLTARIAGGLRELWLEPSGTAA
jgi:para-aminobenzoate synthetase/4-amino-4-deoxychorismate lyase